MEKFSYHDSHPIDVTVLGNMAELVIKNTTWTRWIGESLSKIDAVDPDNGPYITKGYQFGKYTVDKIVSINDQGEKCSVIVNVLER